MAKTMVFMSSTGRDLRVMALVRWRRDALICSSRSLAVGLS
jgi:hypothetical protein